MQQSARVRSIKYGSPFIGTNSEDYSGHPLPVVLYDADGALDDPSPQPSTCTSCSPGRCASATGSPAAIREPGSVARCRLGRVTFCIRGHRCKHEQDADSAAEPQASWPAPGLRGYSIRAAQIVEHADDLCLVVPLVLPCQSPAVRPRYSGVEPQHMALWEGGLDGQEVQGSYSRLLACPCTAHV